MCNAPLVHSIELDLVILVCKPWMLERLFDGQPLRFVEDEEFFYEVLRTLADVPPVFTLVNLSEIAFGRKPHDGLIGVVLEILVLGIDEKRAAAQKRGCDSTK